MNDYNYGSMDHSFTVWCGRGGELSSQDIRNIRAVLRAVLGSSVRLKHDL